MTVLRKGGITMKNEAINQFQDNYNSYMEEQVSKTFGSKVGSGFKAFQHSGGFNYMTYDGLRYNHLTLQCLDSLLKKDNETEQLDLEEGGFSKLYYNVLGSSRYTLSTESQKKVNDAMITYSGQASAAIKAYKDSGLPPLKSTTQSAAIAEIYKNCAIEFNGEVTKDCSIIPNSYLALKIALQQLNNMAGDSAQLVLNEANKNAVIESIISNMTNPNAQNGGIPIDDENNPYYVGYDKIPDSNELIGSLKTKGNAITINVSGESYNSDEMTIHMENESHINIPILSLVDIEIDHKSTFDMNKLKTSEMSVDTEITYSGLTVVPVQATPSTLNGERGWLDETNILKELKEKTNNPDVDGYKLVDNRYKVDELFGGDLAHVKTMLVSKTPSITITISKINMDYARSVFSMDNEVTIRLFGFIKVGGHGNSYKSTNVTYNEEEQSVTLTFDEPEASGTPDVKALTAFIMGGVPEYPGVN